MWACRRGHRSRGETECSVFCQGAMPGIAMNEITTMRRTPVFAGQEIDLICNNNFV
jgi:hypothetical protein